ncbi:MAG: MotA/TolQ/ExbB proton channel family protein [Alphaproteobacteria bacterium]
MALPITPAQPASAQDMSDAAIGAPGGTEGTQHLAWLTAQTRAVRERPYHYLLVLRFALINMMGFAFLATAYLHGLVDMVLVADRTYISALIFVVFLGGLGVCFKKVMQTSRELNQVRSFDPLVPSRASEYVALLRGTKGDTRGILASALRLKLSQRVSVIRQVAGSLVLLGLIGTVVGFIIALSGVHPEQASDVKAITPMVSKLISGMSTALYTTLVGSVLNVWLMINYQLLAGGTVRLITALFEFGEEHARA